MCKSLIISDAHFWDKRLKKLDKLYNILLYEKYDRLILNGDIIDLWINNSIDNIFLDIIKTISTVKEVIWIVGNHDYDIIKHKSDFPNIVITECFEMSDSKKFLFLHGHQVYNNNDMSRFARFVAKTNYFIWNKFGVDIQKIINNTKYYKNYINKKHELIANKFGKNTDTIIIGHTHIYAHYTGLTELYDIGAYISEYCYATIIDGTLQMHKVE